MAPKKKRSTKIEFDLAYLNSKTIVKDFFILNDFNMK